MPRRKLTPAEATTRRRKANIAKVCSAIWKCRYNERPREVRRGREVASRIDFDLYRDKFMAWLCVHPDPVPHNVPNVTMPTDVWERGRSLHAMHGPPFLYAARMTCGCIRFLRCQRVEAEYSGAHNEHAHVPLDRFEEVRPCRAHTPSTKSSTACKAKASAQAPPMSLFGSPGAT